MKEQRLNVNSPPPVRFTEPEGWTVESVITERRDLAHEPAWVRWLFETDVARDYVICSLSVPQLRRWFNR